jgi:hypothetical protein
MRHHHISLTMTYYANVDDAATAAILNRERNSSRNSPADEPAEAQKENPSSVES